MITKQRVKQIAMAGVVTFVSAPALAQMSGAAPSSLPYDTPTVVNGIESVCTGTGDSDENNQRWATYPVKIVLAGKGGQYLSGAAVTVSQKGKDLATVTCNGPWILFKLAPGRYNLSGTLNGETQHAEVYAAQTGQGRVILRFLDQGGMVSPQGAPPSQ